MENIAEWQAYCKANVTAGYTPKGDAINIPETGVAIANFLSDLMIINPGDSILDVGNGNGRLAIGLSLTATNFTYHGLDVIKPCVEFCQRAFAEDHRYQFTHLDVANQHYWAHGKGKQEQVRFPVPDHSIDTVIAFSLFTHLDTRAASQHYLAEMQRVLRPGGTLFATWSFTSMVDNVTLNAKHAVYHINDVIGFYAPFASWRLIPLNNPGSPNQVGICAKI